MGGIGRQTLLPTDDLKSLADIELPRPVLPWRRSPIRPPSGQAAHYLCHAALRIALVVQSGARARVKP
jgi:hypothetical protein